MPLRRRIFSGNPSTTLRSLARRDDLLAGIRSAQQLQADLEAAAAAITRLNQEFNAVLQMPEVRSKLTAAGLEPLGGTPQQLDAFVKADHQRYGTLARELNIKAD